MSDINLFLVELNLVIKELRTKMYKQDEIRLALKDTVYVTEYSIANAEFVSTRASVNKLERFLAENLVLNRKVAV